MKTLNAATSAPVEGARSEKALIAEANKASSGKALERLGIVVGKGNRFECPSCQAYPPSATFKSDDDINPGKRWRCTADGCDASGSIVDLVSLHTGKSDANAARWILGQPTVMDDDGQDHADEITTSIDSANAVKNELPAFVGSETRAEKVAMRDSSPKRADGLGASGDAGKAIFDRAKTVPLSDVLGRLGISVNGHKFKCPAHDDNNPSADFRDKATGKAHSRWQCFACGAHGSGIDLVMHAKGLDKADAARWILGESSPATNGHAAKPKPSSKPSEPAKSKQPKVHKTADDAIKALLYSVRKSKGDNWHVADGWYLYRDAAGEPVLGVVRFEDGSGEKEFRQFSRKGDGWITKSLPSGIPPLSLPEIDKAKPLVVVEGEKAWIAAVEIGLQSTTWAGGSNAVRKTDWSTLAGFDVIVWPDADEPGRKAADDVAKALHGVAARVRILPDDPDAAEGDDAADVLDAMGQEKALEHFRDRLERAIDWTPAEIVAAAGCESEAGYDPRRLPDSDMARGMLLLPHFIGRVRWVQEWKESGWLYWNGRCWERNAAAVERLAKKIIPREIAARWGNYDAAAEAAKRFHVINAVWWVRDDPRILTRPDELDASLWLLNLDNGTFDLKKGELRPHDPADLLTKISPTAYDPAAGCPKFRATLEKFLPDAEIRTFLMRHFGSALTGVITHLKLPILYGLGRNGKSTITNALAYVFGPDYSMTLDAAVLTDDGGRQGTSDRLYHIASLHGMRFVVVNELEENCTLRGPQLKTLISSDKVTGRRPYEMPFSFIPSQKVVMLTNHKPRLRSVDDGTMRRLALVPFEVQIQPGEDKKDFGENLKAEASGILNMLIDGCRDWQAQQFDAPVPAAVAAATESYRSEEDIIGRFAGLCIKRNPGGFATGKEVYDTFKAFCEESGIEPMSGTAFGRRFSALFDKAHAKTGCKYLGIIINRNWNVSD